MLESETSVATYDIGTDVPVPEITPINGKYVKGLTVTFSWQDTLRCFYNYTYDGTQPDDPSVINNKIEATINPSNMLFDYTGTLKIIARTFDNNKYSDPVEREYILVNGVKIKQIDSSSVTFGKAAFWENNSWLFVKPDSAIVLNEGENHFLSTQGFKPNSYQKFNNWDDNTENKRYRNWHTLTIKSNTREVRSNFIGSVNGIKVENYLEMTNYNAINDSIAFKDPWLTDFNEQPYGLRNQGINAPLKTRTSPFKPDYSTSYNGDVYQGVFLKQGYNPDNNQWNPPYYLIKAVSPQTININGANHTFYFQNWGASPLGSATFQNAKALETPVVYNSAGATVKAVMKGTRLSNYSAAYSNNNQRKTAAIRGGEYISVYESMGKIWIEKLKLDGTWELMENGDLASNIYECKNPSIAASGNNLFIVFQENVSNTSFNIRLMAFDVAGNSAVTLDNELVRWASNVSYDNVNPVISTVNSLQNTEILLAWKENGDVFSPAGLYYSNFRLSNQNN